MGVGGWGRVSRKTSKNHWHTGSGRTARDRGFNEISMNFFGVGATVFCAWVPASFFRHISAYFGVYFLDLVDGVHIWGTYVWILAGGEKKCTPDMYPMNFGEKKHHMYPMNIIRKRCPHVPHENQKETVPDTAPVATGPEPKSALPKFGGSSTGGSWGFRQRTSLAAGCPVSTVHDRDRWASVSEKGTGSGWWGPSCSGQV